MTTLKQLIESEIGDFFAGFGQPGEPKTPEEMQSQLLARVMPLLAGMEQEPVGYFYEDGPKNWYQIMDGDSVPPNMRLPLYAAPQLPQPAGLSVPEGVLKSLLPDAEKPDFWFEHNGKIFFEGVKFNNAVFEACRAAMLQGAEPVSQPGELPPFNYLDTVKFNADCAIQDPESIYANEFFLSLDEVFGERGNYSEPVQAKAVSMLIAEVFRLHGYSPAAPQQEVK